MKISVKCFLEFKKLTKYLVILNMYSTIDMSSISTRDSSIFIHLNQFIYLASWTSIKTRIDELGKQWKLADFGMVGGGGVHNQSHCVHYMYMY